MQSKQSVSRVEVRQLSNPSFTFLCMLLCSRGVCKSFTPRTNTTNKYIGSTSMGSDCCTSILVPYQYGFGLLHQYIGPLPVKGRKGHQYYWSLPVKGHNVHQYQSRPVVLASTDVSPHPVSLTLVECLFVIFIMSECQKDLRPSSPRSRTSLAA